MELQLDIGPYPLTWDFVNTAIVKRSAGVIALGEMAPNGRTFLPYRLERAEHDLKHVLFGLVAENTFQYFRCAYTESALAAYDMQCALFHAWAHLPSNLHPVPPSGARLTCKCHTQARKEVLNVARFSARL